MDILSSLEERRCDSPKHVNYYSLSSDGTTQSQENCDSRPCALNSLYISLGSNGFLKSLKHPEINLGMRLKFSGSQAYGLFLWESKPNSETPQLLSL